MTQGEAERIHERLDDVIKVLGQTNANLARYSATCEPCRSIVLGNGKKPISDRVTAIETTLSDMRWFVAKSIAVASIVVTIVVAAVEFAVKVIGA